MIYSASPMTMNKSLHIKCLENLNSLNSNAKAATGALKGVPANQGQNSTENVAATAHPQRTVNGAIAYPRRTKYPSADEDFKREIKQIRKNAEQETLNAIIRFHQREIGRFKAETVKGKRAAPAIALNTKNCSMIEPARAAQAWKQRNDRNSKTLWHKSPSSAIWWKN